MPTGPLHKKKRLAKKSKAEELEELVKDLAGDEASGRESSSSVSEPQPHETE